MLNFCVILSPKWSQNCDKSVTGCVDVRFDRFLIHSSKKGCSTFRGQVVLTDARGFEKMGFFDPKKIYKDEPNPTKL